jgi:hypothetical protein
MENAELGHDFESVENVATKVTWKRLKEGQEQYEKLQKTFTLC